MQKIKRKVDKLVYCTAAIQKLGKELDLPPASFPHLVTDEDITYVQQQKEFRI
ncbi:MAG: hypothetical protein WBE34_19980 [Candidatus Nitrosopolaris sp.]